MEIQNIRKNIMGTVSFDGKFNGMRKAQDFIVYPLKKSDLIKIEYVAIQSDNRFGKINLDNGKVVMSAPRANANSMDLAISGKIIGELDANQLQALKDAIRKTASAKAGNNGVVFCDNSAAALV